MKLKTILSTLFLIAVGVQSYADNVLTASDVSLQAGKTATLEISLNNLMTTFNAFVFDIELPKGVVVASEAGNYLASFNPKRANGEDYNLLVTQLLNGNYRVLGYNNSNQGIEGSEGVLLTLTLQAYENLESGMATGRIITDFTSDEGGSAALGFVNTANLWTYGYEDATFNLSVGDTGIHDLEATETNNTTYNLMGQKVVETSKGIYIQNGKKILKR